MNEVILHFDNASYAELEVLRVKLGFPSRDEVIAYLVETGYERLNEQNEEIPDTNAQPQPTPVEITENTGIIPPVINPVITQQFNGFSMTNLMDRVSEATANTTDATHWYWDGNGQRTTTVNW